jgi:hypothetical protein
MGAGMCGAGVEPARCEMTIESGAGMDEADIRARIEMLRRDHRDLDAAIDALRQMANCDQIQLQRFKKRKLRLRDEIAAFEDMLIPDIIA